MADLYIVTATLTTKTQHQLFYDAPAKARQAYDTLRKAMTHLNGTTSVSLEDDYQASMTVRAHDIVAVDERNWTRQQDAQVDIMATNGVTQAKAQGRAQRRAAGDPELKLLSANAPQGMFRS